MLKNFLKNFLNKRGYDVIEKKINEVNKYYDSQKYLEKNEFKYILWVDRIYKKVINIPGHIVELGVAYGRNSILFSHFIDMNGETGIRKYVGFDTFAGYSDESLKNNKKLNNDYWGKNSFELTSKRVERAGAKNNVTMIEGNIIKTVPNYFEKNEDMKIALLYVDCNAYEPAIFAMNFLKKHFVPGAVICIDEKKHGGETKALIEFCETNNLKFVKDSGPFSIPAYTRIEKTLK